MQITFFGLIWIVLLLFTFFKDNYNYIVFFMLLSTVFQSNSVIVIGGNNGVGPFIITSIVFIITIILKRKNIRYVRYNKIIISLILLLITIIASIVINDKNFSAEKIMYFVQLVLYIVSFILMYNIRSVLDKRFIKKGIMGIILFVMCFGIVQLLIISGIIPKMKIISQLFYNETWNESIAYYSSTKFRLYSTFMEPSYCGAFLVGGFFYIVCEKFKYKEQKIFLLLFCGIEIGLTQSTTAYVSIIILTMIFMIDKRNKKYIKYIIPIGILVCIVMLFSGEVLNRVLFKKLESGSAAERGLWNTKALNSFYNSIFIGIGYKNLRASSIIYSLLGEIGLIGLSIYFYTMIINIKSIFKRTFKYEVLGGSFFLLSVVIAQCISCPDLEFSVLWFAMYLTIIDTISVKDVININNYKLRYLNENKINLK